MRPVHAPNDGDTVFAAATGKAAALGDAADPKVMTELGTVAADCLARAVARGTEHFPTPVSRVLVTGGGRHNATLMEMLDRLLAAYDLAKLKIREANEALSVIATSVKDVLREDRQRRAEIDSVRAGLAKLQAIKV